MPQDNAKRPMCFTAQERGIDGQGVAVSVPTHECCYSFHRADTSADGLLWCLADGVAVSAHYTDLHWEKTGATLYLRVVRDPATRETRFRLVRVPTQRMIPLAVAPGAPGALPTVRADAGGATVLPPALTRTLAHLIARLTPGFTPSSANASEEATEPTPEDAEDAAAILATSTVPLPPQLHRAGVGAVGGHTDALGAVCQALFALPEVRAVYARAGVASSLFHAGPPSPAMSAVLQLAKLGPALCSSSSSSSSSSSAPAAPQAPRTLVPATLQRMLDLSGTDAHSPPARVLAALLAALEADEPAYIAAPARCAPLFRFPVEQRVECDRTGAVAYQWADQHVLELPVPAPTGTAEAEVVDGAACLAAWTAPVRAEHFRHPLFEAEGTAHVTRALARFPRVLAVALARFDAAGTRVCRTRVAMPAVLDADALRAHGGAQNDEQYIYDCPPVRLPGCAGAPDVAPEPACEPGSLAYMERYYVSRRAMLEHADRALVAALTEMGYREEDARKAAVIVDAERAARKGSNEGNNDDDDDDDGGARLEAAVRWLVRHRSDAGLFFADSSSSSSSNDSSSVAGAGTARQQFARSAVPAGPMTDAMREMVAMGFCERYARKALAARYNSVDRAAEWVVDNLQRLVQEDARDDEAERQKAEDARQTQLELQAESRLRQREPKYPANTDSARYELLAVVSCCATAAARSHYVAHIRVPGADDKPVWVLCDGAHLAVADAPPLDRGCLYLYRAADAASDASPK